MSGTVAEPGSESVTSPSGKKYVVTEEQADENDYEDLSEDDVYAGTDRKEAKTSYPDIPTDHIKTQSLDKLIASLKPDEYMRHNHKPLIKRDSPRVKEENVIVRVDAYLFATKNESDNDFHIILSSGTDLSSAQFMTAEVTGIPEDGPCRSRLIKARRQFKDFFVGHLPGTNYRKYSPPIHVVVTGPLFYDIDHPAGAVGPKGYRPETSWEIHPVMDIEFIQ
jgi:hypothetical protein